MASKPGILRKFFGGLWQILSIGRSIVLNLIFVLLVIALVASLMDAPVVRVPQGAALVVKPTGLLVDEASYVSPLNSLTGNPAGSAPAARETLLRDLLRAMELARDDSAISALVLQLDELQGGGFSKLQDLGTAIDDFKSSGKPVYAIADAYTQAQYYVAAHADEILLNPMGGVDLGGFGSYQLFYRSALDRLRVNVHIFRVGTYKSAVEPFELDAMSAEAREASSEWLNDLWDIYVADINARRNLPADTLDSVINNLDEQLARHAGDTARLALETGLVDQLLDRNAIQQKLFNEIGSATDNRNFRQIGHDNYLLARNTFNTGTRAEDRVGVIVASGIIYDGRQRPGNIGGDTLASLIRRAREDDAIKSVVLRIDSPGGSAFASEIIRSELLSLKAAGKPLVVSMGSVAASGGYWIASPADQIWASPATITGSIGIYGIVPTFQDSLDAIGIHTDGVGTTDLTGAFVPGNPLPEVAANALQLSVENGYQRFLNVVSQGRGMSTAEVDAVGQGRVWSGQRAQELGLVDQLGDLDSAIAASASLAGLQEYDTQYLEQRLSPLEQFIMELTDTFTITDRFVQNPAPLHNSLFDLYRRFNEDVTGLLQFNDPGSMYLHCMECSIL